MSYGNRVEINILPAFLTKTFRNGGTYNAAYIGKNRRREHYQKNWRKAGSQDTFGEPRFCRGRGSHGGKRYVIVSVKDSRIAVSREMAQKIMV